MDTVVDTDDIDFSDSDNAWSPVTRYRKRTGGDHTITQKESVVCPQDHTQSCEDDELSDVSNGSRLYTNGAVTVCANDDCDYHINHGVQIKRTQFDTETIGPFQDDSRDRYEHNERVIMNGGFPHAHDYGYDFTVD